MKFLEYVSITILIICMLAIIISLICMIWIDKDPQKYMWKTIGTAGIIGAVSLIILFTSKNVEE